MPADTQVSIPRWHKVVPWQPPPAGHTAVETRGERVTLLYSSAQSGLLMLGYTPAAARLLAGELLAAAEALDTAR